MDITIEEHVGSHREVAWSFREAEDSEDLLESYIDLGRVWVAVDPAGRTVGHLQAVPRDDNGYPPGLEVDGIPLLDQVWFERAL